MNFHDLYIKETLSQPSALPFWFALVNLYLDKNKTDVRLSCLIPTLLVQ